MSEPRRTLEVGRVRLARIPGGEGNGTMQVACGVDDTGAPVVFLRAGAFVLAITPEGTRALARELIAEAQLAEREHRA